MALRECWETTHEAMQPYSAFAGGAIFGAGWWIFGDALVYHAAVLGLPFSVAWLVPGVLATLAIVVMNSVSHEDVSGEGYGDDSTTCRSRVVLMLSYFLSMGAVAAAVALLVAEKHKSGDAGPDATPADMWMGASSVISVCLICASGLVTWLFHSSDNNGYSYMYM
uniref:Transmembrane protein 50A n=1 Tax=Chlamydomonas euryale TaxID=1486919 RepID=A0A7R9VEK8_9CHLO|mmetsp:Transcript_32221/g.96195  ORF Transcript_32221/g.96195 Transcript_32221/m.96195 type:complete len:166 (+) Transcript_32221:575-1072(+)